ncbi:MAG: restriction endonuclease subunit R, partial [bacterium]|nr:restriction endonuclease subunit R [bacterium]
TLDRNRSLSMSKLLERFAWGAATEDDFESLAVRLSRLAPFLTENERTEVETLTGGKSPRHLAAGLLDAVNADVIQTRAQTLAGGPGAATTPEHIATASAQLMAEAADPFNDPDLRKKLQNIKQRTEMTIDTVSKDTVIEAAFTTDQAQQTVTSFREFLEQNRDEITALQLLFSQPYRRQSLTLRQIEELRDRIQMPPHAWTTESLWQAYAQLEQDKVRGVRTTRTLTDIVSLVRHALQLDDELIPYPEHVQQRYQDWLAAQEADGRAFSGQQRWWFDRIAETIALNLSATVLDFQYGQLRDRGGMVAARELFGEELTVLLAELNAELAV